MWSKTTSVALMSAVLLGLAFFPAVQSFEMPYVGGSPEQPTESEASWLVMVYVALDNNIWPLYYLPLLLDLQMASPTENVEVIILADGQIDGDTMLMRGTDGLEVIEHLGELNMGDPSSLKYLVDYSTSRYDADKTLLFIMDHGGSWRGSCVDGSGLLVEETDLLTMPEFRAALEGHHFDVLFWDACEMGSLEVAYEVRDIADYMVASEETVLVSPSLAMNVFLLQQIIGLLDAYPEKDPREACEGFIDLYNPTAAGAANLIFELIDVTQTYQVVDLSEVDEVALAVDRLGSDLLKLLPEYRGKIAQARKDTKGYLAAPEHYNGELKMVPLYVDLYELTENLERTLPGTGIDEACGEIRSKLEPAVIGTKGDPRSHGLSINFPSLIEENPIEVYESLAYRYSQLRFSELAWDEFINLYTGVEITGAPITGEGGSVELLSQVVGGKGGLDDSIAGFVIGMVAGGLLTGLFAFSLAPTLVMLLIGAGLGFSLALNALSLYIPDLPLIQEIIPLIVTMVLEIPMIYGTILLLVSLVLGVFLGVIGLLLGFILTPLWALIGAGIGLGFGIPPQGLLDVISKVPLIGAMISDMVKLYLVLWLYLPIPTLMAAFLKSMMGSLIQYLEFATQRAIMEPLLAKILPGLIPLLDIWLPLGQTMLSLLFGITGRLRNAIGLLANAQIGAIEALTGFLDLVSIVPVVGDELSDFVTWFGDALARWLDNLAQFRGIIP